MLKLATAAIVALASASLLAGCASTPTPKPKPTAASLPTSYPGENAATIAGRIKGCTGVSAGDIGKGGPALASTASCTLDGRLLNVNSWADAESADLGPILKSTGAEAYYAHGDAWTVTVGDDPTLQMQLTNDAGGLLKRTLDGATAPAPDLPGEKASAESVVRFLGGAVIHVPAAS